MSKSAKEAAILSIVNYDKVINYELKHPATGEGLGVIIKLSSQGATAVRDLTRKQFSQSDIAQKMNGTNRIAVAEQLTEERLTACIAGWDFNGKILFEGDKGEPELNQENKLKLVQCPWVFDQLNKQVNDVANFTSP